MRSFLTFIFLSALLVCCAPGKKDTPNIAVADSIRIRYYDDKSAFFQPASPDSAIHYARLGLQLATKLKNLRGEALLVQRFAAINEQYGNYELALKYQRIAKNVYSKLADKANIEQTSLILSVLESRTGKINEGQKLAGSILHASEIRRDTNMIIMALTKLGLIAEIRKKNVKALYFYERAEALHGQRDAGDDYIDLLTRIGRLHADSGHHKKAQHFFNKGITRSDNTRHRKKHLILLHHTARSLDSAGNHNLALEMHQQALLKARKYSLREEEALALIGIAGSLKERDANRSIQHLRNALQIAHETGQKHLAAEIYKSLAEVYHQQSRYTEAIEALQAHHRLLDSLMDVNKARKLAVLRSSYELAETKLNNETLLLSNKQKTYQRNLGIVAAASTLVILALLGLYSYRVSRLVAKLDRSNKIKDRLFSIIGHDLRNPIGGITQLLALMEDDNLDAEHRQLISEMRKQGDITLEILNALLNWGEAQLKGIHIKPETFYAAKSTVTNIEALQRQAADKSVSIINQIPDNLKLHADQNHFEFIVRNLLSNAIKFSYKGEKVLIGTQQMQKGNHVTFYVQDKGKGISKAQQQLFSSSDMNIAYGTAGEKGTGIGLTLCKEFVKANNGTIWLESTEGKGATFYFTFPVA
ncbi:hypothetical protein GCM10023149_07470 [Mucilaginibacter gynuensis]|uniref:histidine kinase n=1 Tax=Mucilaginibacter gynuensis TaxID=1302236 RepID=A0ABP8FW71_9SPHI